MGGYLVTTSCPSNGWAHCTECTEHPTRWMRAACCFASIHDTLACRGEGVQVRKNSIFTKRWVKGSAVLVATAATLAFAAPQQAIATPLKGVESAAVSQTASNVVDINFADGIKGRITFLEDGIFRYNVDPRASFPNTPRRAANRTQPRFRHSPIRPIPTASRARRCPTRAMRSKSPAARRP